ncbi:extracellular solute-binding protein [Streptomyces sp. DH37]|uniref:extracellular solute-binding protein n=1 Tax=Streptomyces sp. DH37 TaxID=3040122 RepID=UPI002441E87F|nr:extracellular solute-binding protein [Streptomyces sp. DH37]MDG9703925.1 extracellular solute-binding protein [Streptomyces sp. DH37]
MRRPGAVRAAVACLLAVLPAAACERGATTAPAPPPTGAAGGTITVASGLDVTGTDGVRHRLIEEWNRRNPEHPARLVQLSGAADQQRSQLLGALQSGSASYDVVNLDITWIPEFAEAGLISPLDGRVDLGDFIDRVADTASWKGHVYSVPFNSDVGLLYYRKDYLEEAGIGPSLWSGGERPWSKVTAAIDALDAQRNRPEAYEHGWTGQLGAYEGLTVNAIEAFASAGVRLTDDKGNYTADRADLEEGLRALGERVAERRLLPDALTSDETTSLDDFTEGRTAFLRHWPYAYGLLWKDLPRGSFDVTRLPGKAVLGGQNLAVAAGSPRARWALELVEFLTGRSSERCLLDAGFAATRESAYADPGVTCGITDGTGGESTRAPTVEGSGPVPADAEGRPAHAAELLVSLKNAEQRPRTPYYGAFTQALQSHLHRWLERKAPDPEAAAAELDEALRKALEGR